MILDLDIDLDEHNTFDYNVVTLSLIGLMLGIALRFVEFAYKTTLLQ